MPLARLGLWSRNTPARHSPNPSQTAPPVHLGNRNPFDVLQIHTVSQKNVTNMLVRTDVEPEKHVSEATVVSNEIG